MGILQMRSKGAALCMPPACFALNRSVTKLCSKSVAQGKAPHGRSSGVKLLPLPLPGKSQPLTHLLLPMPLPALQDLWPEELGEIQKQVKASGDAA
eukprot:5338315-Amphidinium_carterae.2